ncbi:MAG: hypothetical protein K2N64_01080 [Anaeroplasmataceae bacterium]|nr:hypothetical protein [Anaeroplasmataceae bacterium]
MKKYIFNVNYAIYCKSPLNNEYVWKTGHKVMEVTADSLFKGYWKTMDSFKSWLKNRNPILDEALENQNVYTDIELMI